MICLQISENLLANQRPGSDGNLTEPDQKVRAKATLIDRTDEYWSVYKQKTEYDLWKLPTHSLKW